MLFRIPASHAQIVRVADPQTDVSAAILAAFDSLGWKRHATDAGFKAEVGANLWSWGEAVTVVRLGDGRLSVESRCRMPLQIMDWGKNRQNVERLCAALEAAGFTTEPPA